MNFDLDFIMSNALVIVPIVIAITQAIKLTGFVKDHFSPLVSIVVGILVGWMGHHENPELSTILLGGTIYGLIASGLYSGVKTTMQARNQQIAEEARKKQAQRGKQND
jgi:uncharacterized membrane protein (DUF441 family)